MPDDPNDQGQQGNEPQHIKDLRKKAADFDKLEADAKAKDRELAFIKAGFDTDHPLVANLMSSYNGDLTKDAVKAHMDGLQVASLLQPKPETPPADGQQQGQQQGQAQGQQQQGQPQGQQQQQQPGGQQTQDRLGTIDGGQAPTDVPSDDPRKVGLAKAFDALEAGQTREDAASLFFGEVFTAAVKGDERVLTVNNREAIPEPEPSR